MQAKTLPTLPGSARLEQARGALLLIHGRGATAESMLSLAEAIDAPDLALIAPQAPGYTWYPYPFMTPIAQNEPHLSNALRTLDDLFRELTAAGVPPEKVLLVGFSQGACLSLEYAARNARRYGGIAGLSGGLIGPPGTPRDYPGSLDGTPIFLGCSDIDPHIPKERVLESERVLRDLGAQVTARLYPGIGHTVNEDELAALQALARGL